MKNIVIIALSLILIIAPRVQAENTGIGGSYILGVADNDCLNRTTAQLKEKYAAVPYSQVAMVCLEVLKNNQESSLKRAIKNCAKKASRKIKISRR